MTADQSAVRAGVDAYVLAEAGGLAGVGPVPAGTNLLVLGPPMVGKDDLVAEVVGTGLENGQPGVVVSPGEAAGSLRRSHAALGDAYVVDCSRVGESDGFDPDRRIATISSPEDVTGIGMGVVKCTRAVGGAAERGVRMGVLSLSTMLQLTDADRVFNFLHVLTGRISAAGYLGVFALDPTVHDDTTVNTIKAQFDGAIRLRQGTDGVEIETVGL